MSSGAALVICPLGQTELPLAGMLLASLFPLTQQNDLKLKVLLYLDGFKLSEKSSCKPDILNDFLKLIIELSLAYWFNVIFFSDLGTYIEKN